MGCGASAGSKYENVAGLSDVGESAKQPIHHGEIRESHKSHTQGSTASAHQSSNIRVTDHASKYHAETLAEDLQVVEDITQCSQTATDADFLKKYEKISGKKKRASSCVFALRQEEPLLYSALREQSPSSGDEEHSTLGSNKIGSLRLHRPSGEKSCGLPDARGVQMK